MSQIQSLLFSKQQKKNIKGFLKRNHIRELKRHITKNFIRVRVRNPKQFRRFRIIPFKSGVKAVIGFKK